MGIWLQSALKLLGVGTLAGAGTTALERVTGIDVPLLGESAAAYGGRRRRRRRALTQSDRDDISFISATLGEGTGRKFALVLASRMGR